MMPNYKEMYLDLFRASEEAIDLLIAAQRRCEEMYISSSEPEPETDLSPAESEEE